MADAAKSPQPEMRSAGPRSSWTAGRCGTAFKGRSAAAFQAWRWRRKSHWACAAQAGLTSQASAHVSLQSGRRRRTDWQQVSGSTDGRQAAAAVAAAEARTSEILANLNSLRTFCLFSCGFFFSFCVSVWRCWRLLNIHILSLNPSMRNCFKRISTISAPFLK